jgi:hypothetical protein
VVDDVVHVTEADQQKLLQKIGAEVSRIAAGATGRILNYLEADDGVISTAVYFLRGDTVVFKFPSDELVDLLAELWDATRSDEPAKQWKEMAYLIEEGRFRVEFFYPEDITDERPDVKQRKHVKHYFGVDEWDDSDPELDAN